MYRLERLRLSLSRVVVTTSDRDSVVVSVLVHSITMSLHLHGMEDTGGQDSVIAWALARRKRGLDRVCTPAPVPAHAHTRCHTVHTMTLSYTMTYTLPHVAAPRGEQQQPKSHVRTTCKV